MSRPPVRVAAVLLAGGSSRRMGRAKQSLRLDGDTLLQRAVAVLAAAPVAPVVVVLRHGCAPPAGPGPLTVVETPDEGTAGMAESLQLGLSALPSPVDGVLVTLVDLPGQTSELVESVVTLFRESGAGVVLPRFRGRRGHPVLFRWDLVGELLALPPEGRPSQVLDRHEAEAVFVELADDRPLVDLDTPGDVERWCLCSKRQ